ncbi:uncharacterized protein LOC121882772 [Thunnus maccoyii]|uniref:uncharacterized protein LOC121882772 n=1 Tax=Thunnus maccoyii TaxID=8240 RepID=UPI001C4D6DA2|nr:uncharacterized protein LOC121882772 [Thunnus maccoyii]
MVELRWIKMSLFLILGLHFTAVTGQTSLDITVRVGDEVTLSCENVMTDQDKCNSISWIFSGLRNTAAVELIEVGQIGENAKAKSDRLSVTVNCSLVIKKVTVEDVGRYTCRQFKSGQQQGQDSRVYLSVVTMTEHKDTDKVTLNCSVSTYEQCRQTVKWVYEGNDWDVNTHHMKESQSSCFATVMFTTSHLAEMSKYSESFKCNVTDKNKVQLFAFSPQSSVILNKADPEDGVSYVSISFTKKTNSKARVRGDGDDEGDAVTYSTVKASSSSAGASTDPSNLYATIN